MAKQKDTKTIESEVSDKITKIRDKTKGSKAESIKQFPEACIIVNKAFKDITGGTVDAGMLVLPKLIPFLEHNTDTPNRLGILVSYNFVRNETLLKEGKAKLQLDENLMDFSVKDEKGNPITVKGIQQRFIECISYDIVDNDAIMNTIIPDLEKLLKATGKCAIHYITK